MRLASPAASLGPILAVALSTGACQPQAPTPRDGTAAALRRELVGSSSPVIRDSATRAPADTGAEARVAAIRAAWAKVDTSKIWYARDRRLDLTGDGVADHFAVVAKGARSDSLIVRIFAVVGRDTFLLEGFYGDYLLVDPPFPQDTARPVVDAYVRSSLAETVDSARVTIDSLTPQYFDERGSDCGLDFPGCLREALGEDSARIGEFEERLTKGTFRLLSYNYGYESSITVFWFAPLKRFLGIYECC